MSEAIVINGMNIAEAEIELRGLGFKVRPVTVNDCAAADPDIDLFLIEANSSAQVNELLAQLKAVAPADLEKLVMTEKRDLSRIDLDLIDDFIMLPFDPEEMRVRLRLHLEKLKTDGNSKLQIEDLILNQDNYEVTADERIVALTYKEFELLRFLMSHRGRVFTREKLVEEIWQYDYFSGTRTVDVHIRRLRAKLGPKYGYYIQTVRNVGYRFGR